MRSKNSGKSIVICLMAVDLFMKDKNNGSNFSFPEGFTEPHILSGVQPNTSILVGFSGGADSRALLDMLVKYARIVGCSVYAAHVNHCIRGQEADRDEEFCRSVAKEYGIPFFVKRVDIPALAQKLSKSVELCARDERYAFFAEIMRERSIPLLATAHNADDNLETLIFNLSRGSGLSGLCGIPPKRLCAEGMLIRPILLMSKASVLSYCKKNQLDFVTDSTNIDTDYTRNKIRAEIIPIMRELVSSPEKKASEASALLRRDNEFLNSLADELLSHTDDDDAIDAALLLSAHEAISSRALMRLFEKFALDSLEQVHVNSILELCRAGKNNSRVSLPSKTCGQLFNGIFRFLPQSELDTSECDSYSLELGKGEHFISQINAEIVIGTSHREINIYKKSIQFTINSAKINGTFLLRARKSGDKIFMGGMHKSIKKLMCDKKIPPELRHRIPMICVGDEIIAVPFVGISDSANPKKNKNNENNDEMSIQFYLY